MRGYAALARIDASAIHVARAAMTSTELPPAPPGDVPAPVASAPARAVGPRLAELAGIVREQWAITTFYLFDPESWR